MKLIPTPRRARAFTMTELAIVIVMLLLLGVVMMYYLAVSNRPHPKGPRLKCLSNLKQIGLAYKVFANDNDDKFPFQFTNSLAYGNVTQAWLHFQAMSNECGSAKILTCPTDRDRLANMMSDFGMGPSASPTSLSTKSNSAVSYFASLDADETLPNTLLSGDRHLLTNRFNMDGRLFLATTNITGAHWTTNQHDGAGNIALSDGSVQQVTSSSLTAQMHMQGIATNRLLLPLLP